MEGTLVTVDTYEGASTLVSRQKHYFCGVPGENPDETVVDYAWWKRGVKYKTEIYDGTSTLVTTQASSWEQRPPNTGENAWWSGSVNGPEVPRMEPRSQSMTTTVNQGGPIVAKREFLYDEYNNQTDVYEYDWDDTTPIRRTHLEYETNSDYLDQPVHIRGLVTKQWVCGSGSGACTEGSAVAKTEYVYDGESLQAAAHSTVVGHLGGSYKSLTAIPERGNLTKVRRWRNLPTSTWIESRVKYNVLGMPIEAIDPLGHSTTVSYNDNFKTAPTGNVLAYPTSTTRSGQTAETEYDYWLGKPTRFTDLNDVETEYTYNDYLDRITKMDGADNYTAVTNSTRYFYHWESSRFWTVAFRDLNTLGDNALKTTTYYDSMWRVVGTRDTTCAVAPPAYDGLGRLVKAGTAVSMTCYDPNNFNNYWPPAVGSIYTEFQYDGLGRRTAVIAPGGAETTITYSGASVTVEDAAGKSKKATRNALGQLVELIEDPGGLNYITEYSYDTLGNLTQVYQKGNSTSDTQTRTFTYDSLGRRLSADNPEDVVVGTGSGRIDYAYDNDSKLTSTTDARGVTTTYYYDSLDRLIKRTFSDSTPTEHNCYDGKVFDHYSTGTCVTPGTAIPFSVGRLTSSAVEGVGSVETREFDPLGRALSSKQITWYGSGYTSYDFTYTYNLAGLITSMTYPSGREIEYAYDSAGRPYSVGEDGGASYVNSVSYGVHGGVVGTQLGNLLHEQNCYNARLQPVAKRLGDDATTTDCAWDADDKLQLTFGFGSDTTNNGNLAQQTIKASASYSWTQYYTYDDVNRLAMASENAAITGSSCPSGATWCRQFGYDHFGNRWISASLDTLHMATPTLGSAIDLDTNRLTAGTFDAAGNLTAHPYITTGSGSMSYDANNKMTSFTATGVSVATDYAGGARMRKVFNSETTIWVYDAMGRLAAEYRNGTGPGLSASTPDKEFIYMGGKLAAMVEDSEIYYRTTDHLGSSRAVTDSVGAVVKRQDFFPFGETIPASSSYGGRNNVTDDSVNTYNASLGMKQQFTGQQRDEETDIDYFWARCMIPALARFTSADPGNAGAKLDTPQGWNAYSYVNNNPLRYTDPTGTLILVETEEPDNYWDWWNWYHWFEGMKDSPIPPPPTEDEFNDERDGRREIGELDAAAEAISRQQFWSQDCLDLMTKLAKAGARGSTRLAKDRIQVRAESQAVDWLRRIAEGAVDVMIKSGIGSTTKIVDAMGSRGQNQFFSSHNIPVASRPYYTIGDYFSNNPAVNAFTPIGMGTIWINPSGVNVNSSRDAKALIMHELMHDVLRMVDEDLQMGFGLPVDTGNTGSITSRLKSRCITF